MSANFQKTIGVMALTLAAAGAGASDIPDDAVAAVEPRLEIDTRLGGRIGWLDEQTLLVTALIDRDSQFWERKVMLVDARTGQAREFIREGALLCANAMEGIAGMLVGSQGSIYTGGSKAAQPQLSLFKWNAAAGELAPMDSGGIWNAWICRKTRSEDVDVPDAGFLRKETRYLEFRDGSMEFTWRQSAEKVYFLVKDGRRVEIPDVRPADIVPVPLFLAFRDEYLLSAGEFVMDTTMRRGSEPPTREFPILTMTTSGQVKREFVRPRFESAGFKGSGSTLPYAQGALIVVQSRPQQGGGIYLNQGESLKRIWCTNDGGVFDRKCRTESPAISPNGCSIAFFAAGSDSRKAYTHRPTLKILPLCK